jgi:hypothetical protein
MTVTAIYFTPICFSTAVTRPPIRQRLFSRQDRPRVRSDFNRHSLAGPDMHDDIRMYFFFSDTTAAEPTNYHERDATHTAIFGRTDHLDSRYGTICRLQYAPCAAFARTQPTSASRKTQLHTISTRRSAVLSVAPHLAPNKFV